VRDRDDAAIPRPGHATDPAEAALHYLTSHAAAFQLGAADAASFVVARVDVEPRLDMCHVTLQRTLRGIPVFQGAITIHMDGGNGVFRALGDEFYRVGEPTNRILLTPAEAALAAGKVAGVSLRASRWRGHPPAL
jgi:Zn-dependent metalloprotease